MKKITLREISEFDIDFKIAVANRLSQGSIVDLDKDIELLEEPVDINFDGNHFLISLNQYVSGYKNDSLESTKLSHLKNRTVEWVGFLLEKFGAKYATQGVKALCEYSKIIDAEHDERISRLDKVISHVVNLKAIENSEYQKKCEGVNKMSYECGMTSVVNSAE